MATLDTTGTTRAFDSESEPALMSDGELDAAYEVLEEQVCCGENLRPVVIEGGCRMATCRHCKKQYFEQGQIHDARSPWIGVDLDGTLASDTGQQLWDAEGRPKIGQPIPEMVSRVKGWVAQGITVKIFTARAYSASQVAAIRTWLARRGLPDLEVTNVKDFNMITLWDDRCIQVNRNSGRPVNPEVVERQNRMATARMGGLKPELKLISRLRFFFTL